MPVWVNGKFLNTENKKAEKWIPEPQKEKVLWKLCPDCGTVICEGESCWPMVDKTVCVSNGCWKRYYAQGIGYHDCAGLVLPGVSLEG